MKFILFTINLITIISINGATYNYAHYYGKIFTQISNKSSTYNLKEKLNRILSLNHIYQKGKADLLTDICPNSDELCYKHRPLSYQNARKQLFGNLYLQTNDHGVEFVQDVYCTKKYSEKDFSKYKTKYPNIGKMCIPYHRVINTEHTWPKSRFNMNEDYEIIGSLTHNQKISDLHHLFPSESTVNGQRGNFKFAKVFFTTENTSCIESKLGLTITPDGVISSSIFFEPPDQHKGNAARAMFYFSTRYQVPIDRTEEFYLRKWHNSDPPSTDEIIINNKIFILQGTRNPYIDYPQFVDMVDDF